MRAIVLIAFDVLKVGTIEGRPVVKKPKRRDRYIDNLLPPASMTGARRGIQLGLNALRHL